MGFSQGPGALSFAANGTSGADGDGGSTLALGGTGLREYDGAGRCYEENSVHLYSTTLSFRLDCSCVDGLWVRASNEAAEWCCGIVRARGESGDQAGRNERDYGTGREKRSVVFGHVIVSEGWRICAGHGRGSGPRHGIHFSIRRGRERQGSVS